jgi:UDP-N-acetyl-D-glucosamine/UDP-N-acetyl-D-galactosamine dehydrogenase
MKNKIAIVGLGYVGLPLAVEFGKIRDVVGFDINGERVTQLNKNIDYTFECTSEELTAAKHAVFTNHVDDLAECSIYIITVPTPIDEAKKPDLSALISASRLVGSVLNTGDIVVYESTVYPGATEEVCVPILEDTSELTFNEHFYCGYSPERINPGDKLHRLPNITKVTSGSTPEIAGIIDELYREIILAGTWKAESIRVAEAAKVIENTQRDLNIALINELSLIFDKLGIDTQEVLAAAATKWNFLNFKPGLVGGHCIGVDPYYLTHKAQTIGYHPEIILAGRKLNDDMPRQCAQKLLSRMLNNGINGGTKILIAGFAFKENCPDVRNTKVFELWRELTGFGFQVDIWDPVVNQKDVKHEYGITLVDPILENTYSALILAVPHDEIIERGPENLRKLCISNHILYDLKSAFPKEKSDLR